MFAEKKVETAAQVATARTKVFWPWEKALYGEGGGSNELEAIASWEEDILISSAILKFLVQFPPS